MRVTSRSRRNLVDLGVKTVSVISAAIGILFLFWIIYEVLKRGSASFNWNFFTQLPTPPGVPGGGVANAIMGTLAITVIATGMGVPLGMLSGIYLAEYGQYNRFGTSVRFTVNVLMGIPSIITGLFVYTIMVLNVGHFSGYAGAVSLAIIMLPVVARTTEDMLRLVPNELRESALALGAPRWSVILGVVFRSAKTGIITGTMLAIARVSGETAPLLFTALNSPYWVKSLNEPTANLTVTIFNFAMSPYEDWQSIAWGASLIIMIAVLAVTIITRIILKEGKK